MSRRKSLNKSKAQVKSADSAFPNEIIAAVCGIAILQYTEFVFFSAVDDNGHTADIPTWRVHMGSTCLGAITFVIALYCCEALEYKSKRLAVRVVIPWLPLVALTGLATIIHVPVLIVVIMGMIYAVWAYLRSRAERRLANGS